MNRVLWLGITIFLSLVGLSLTGGSRQVLAGHGCHGCHGYVVVYDGCYGCYGCYGCWGDAHVVRYRCVGRARWACVGCHGCAGCHACHDCAGCHGVQPGNIEPTPAPKEPPQPPEAMSKREGAATNLAAGGAPLETRLALRVSPDAKVFLAGRPTRSTGTLRQYVTTQLVAGHQWRDYPVDVEMVRNGKSLKLRKRVTLNAGQAHQLSFDFEPGLTMY